jgi:hypothetical protein
VSITKGGAGLSRLDDHAAVGADQHRAAVAQGHDQGLQREAVHQRAAGRVHFLDAQRRVVRADLEIPLEQRCSSSSLTLAMSAAVSARVTRASSPGRGAG